MDLADKVTGTANLRLRQAFVTLSKGIEFKGRHILWLLTSLISLNAGAPFNPFSRTPLVQYEYK